MRIAQGNHAQESAHPLTTSTQPIETPPQTEQTGPSNDRQDLRELGMAITQEPDSTSAVAQTGRGIAHQEFREVDMSAPPGNPTQEPDDTSSVATHPAVPGVQAALVDNPQELRDVNMGGTPTDLTQEHASNVTTHPAVPGVQAAPVDDLQESREVNMSGTTGDFTQEPDETSNIGTHPAVPRVQAAPVDNPQELREVDMSGRPKSLAQEHTSNVATHPAVPQVQATAQTDASGALQQTEDDDLSDTVDCLCVINGYIDLDTMRFIDGLPIKWSLTWQKKSLDLILRYGKVLRDVHNANKTQGSRYLCERHIKELARGVGLRLQGLQL